MLARAMSVAAPAGLVIWLLAHTDAGRMSLLDHMAEFLDPYGKVYGGLTVSY